jgi:hypothetical protein
MVACAPAIRDSRTFQGPRTTSCAQCTVGCYKELMFSIPVTHTGPQLFSDHALHAKACFASWMGVINGLLLEHD